MQKHKTQYQKNAVNTVHCGISVVYPRHDVADGELWLAATAQHPERVWYRISLVQENSKIQNSKYDFS